MREERDISVRGENNKCEGRMELVREEIGISARGERN